MAIGTRIGDALARALQDLSIARHLRGASLFRILGGTAILLEYLMNYAQRAYLFGPNGVFPFESYVARHSGFPLYAFSQSTAYFELIYHLGIVIAFAWTLGIKTRWLTPLTLISWRALHDRNGMLWDGGDNLMGLLLIYACFVNVSAHWSFDAGASKLETDAAASKWRDASGILHNAALLAMAIQICLVYGIAGLTKVQGEVWRDGTALYFAFIDPEHGWPGVTEHLWKSGPLLTLLAYFTVAFQIGFTFLLFLNRWSRRCAVCIALSFHVGIALCMGLVTFGMFMMAADLALIEDADYESLGAGWRALVRRFAPRREVTSPTALRPGDERPLAH